MALSTSTVMEVRTGGNATNGGGFVAGASGTDWSQQDAAQYSVADGVTAGTTTITSATAAFGTDVVGNLIYVAGGTGGVVGNWYQITVRTNATTITVDRATGLTAGTGVTLKIGGALDSLVTLGSMLSSASAILRSFVKAGTGYTHTATATLPSAGGAGIICQGYTTTRGDNGRASITLSTNSGLTGIAATAGWKLWNFDINCASLATSTGISNTTGHVRNCKVSNFTVAGITTTCPVEECEVTGGTSAATQAVSASGWVGNCNIHDNACPGIIVGNGIPVFNNRIVNNTGASSDGIRFSGNTNNKAYRNTCHGNGRHGIFLASVGGSLTYSIRDNLLTGNGASGTGYGLAATSSIAATPDMDGNVYGGGASANTSGTRNNVDSVAAVLSVGAYTNVRDVTLTGDPYTNAAGGDFTLNNTAGAGAACRAAGFPGTITGATGTGYADAGAYQHQDSGGSGGLIGNSGLTGGMQ